MSLQCYAAISNDVYFPPQKLTSTRTLEESPYRVKRLKVQSVSAKARAEIIGHLSTMSKVKEPFKSLVKFNREDQRNKVSAFFKTMT